LQKIMREADFLVTDKTIQPIIRHKLLLGVWGKSFVGW